MVKSVEEAVRCFLQEETEKHVEVMSSDLNTEASVQTDNKQVLQAASPPGRGAPDAVRGELCGSGPQSAGGAVTAAG